MAELTKNRFLLLVLLMIFPAHALDVIFSSALKDFKQKFEIKTYIEDGEKRYGGTLDHLSYRPKPETFKVIVYIVERSRFVEIIRNAVRGIRLQIAQELRECHCELVFLGIDNFDDDEYDLIGSFMVDKIRPRRGQTNFTTEIIGENRFDRPYQGYVMNFERYQENIQICGGALRSHLRDIARGALRPVESNDKEIRLYGYHPTVGEVKWPVCVTEDNKYSTIYSPYSPIYNFKIRHPDKKICLLILSGREYLAVTDYGHLSRKTVFTEILDGMTNNGEVLLILGAFNFDWTEIDIVTQMILQHSDGWREIEGLKHFDYNVYTCGYGMFNTAYLNMDIKDGRFILQQTNSYVTELIKILMGKVVKQRFIEMYHSNDNRWTGSKMPINLGNGRYIAEKNSIDYRFPWVDHRIAFIVYDSTEKSDQIDFLMVNQAVTKLERSGICLVLIEAINFCSDDIHIIAEWIDYHKGVINSERIAVLGGGIFDTIFQSHFTTYNTLFNANKNELKTIRNAFVQSGNDKRIFAANIDDLNFEVWSFPMNTVNGFHEPDLIPDKNMFDTIDKKRIFFIITSAYMFRRVETMEKPEVSIPLLRGNIAKFYSKSIWRVFLVGLDNFRGRDRHLFAELVKRQTNYGRSLDKMVIVYNYGITCGVYQYKDSPPFPIEISTRVHGLIEVFFGICMSNYTSNRFQ